MWMGLHELLKDENYTKIRSNEFFHLNKHEINRKMICKYVYFTVYDIYQSNVGLCSW